MDYKRILIDGYKEKDTTPYVSYFKREAQKVHRDEFVEFADFFNACKRIIEGYKNRIKSQYFKRLHENDWVLRSIYSGNGMKFNGVIVRDQNDERIKENVKYIEDDKEFVESRGYENNHDFVCEISETGEISNDSCNTYSLYYPDLADLENSITQAEQELTSTTATLQPSQTKDEVGKGRPQRTITNENIEKLKSYFTPAFINRNAYNKAHFDEYLLPDLQKPFSKAEFTAIAKLIYDSKVFNIDFRKNLSFNKWRDDFFDMIEVTRATYKENAPKVTGALQKLNYEKNFFYLPNRE
jgi:hypothetical protein